MQAKEEKKIQGADMAQTLAKDNLIKELQEQQNPPKEVLIGTLEEIEAQVPLAMEKSPQISLTQPHQEEDGEKHDETPVEDADEPEEPAKEKAAKEKAAKELAAKELADKNGSIEGAYAKAFSSLQSFASLENNGPDLKKKLEALLTQVETMKTAGRESEGTLTTALKKTLELCNSKDGKDLETYKEFANQMKGRPSLVMSILGGLMFAVGVAVAVAAGLAVAPLDMGTTLIAAGSVSAALGATFFGLGTRKSGLCKAMNNVNDAQKEALETTSKPYATCQAGGRGA